MFEPACKGSQFRVRRWVIFQTSAPRPTAASIRLLTAIGCDLDFDMCRFDTEQGFVQPELEGDAFMRLPEAC